MDFGMYGETNSFLDNFYHGNKVNQGCDLI